MDTHPVVRRVSAIVLVVTVSLPVSVAADTPPAGPRHRGVTITGQSLFTFLGSSGEPTALFPVVDGLPNRRTGPLLAQRAEPNASPGLGRMLKQLQEREGSALAPLSGAPSVAATHPDLSRLQTGVLYQQTGPSRGRGDVALNASYALLFGGLALVIVGFAGDPNSTGKVVGGFAMMGGAFVVSCSTGGC